MDGWKDWAKKADTMFLQNKPQRKWTWRWKEIKENPVKEKVKSELKMIEERYKCQRSKMSIDTEIANDILENISKKRGEVILQL